MEQSITGEEWVFRNLESAVNREDDEKTDGSWRPMNSDVDGNLDIDSQTTSVVENDFVGSHSVVDIIHLTPS